MENRDCALLEQAISDRMIIRTAEPGSSLSYIGQKMLDFLGYSSSEEFFAATEGKIANFIHPHDVSFVTARMAQPRFSEGYSMEYRIRKKDGSYLPVQDRGEHVHAPDGRTLIFFTYCALPDQSKMGLLDESRLYGDIVQQSTHGIYVIEQESHRLLYTNHAMDEIFASAGIHDYLGEKCYCALRHRMEPCTQCLVHPALHAGEPQEIYLDFLSKYYAVASHSVQWRGVPAYVIYLSDISEEKKANHEIARIYNNIPGAVFRCKCDADWTVISANDGLFSFFGYSREEFAERGNRISAVVYPEDFPGILPDGAAPLPTGDAAMEHEQRFVCKNGTIKWAFIRAQLLESKEEGTFLYCVLVDISEQKKAQFELRKTQLKLAAAIDHAGLAYWEYDIANSRAYLNAISTAEYTLDEVIENYPAALYASGAIHPESIARYDSLVQAVKSGQATAQADIKTLDAKGNLVWKRVRFTTLFDENKQPFWAVATAESIDDYKALESRFATVLEQNHIDTWMYDLSRRTIIQNHNTEGVYGVSGREIPNVPESLIEGKRCHPEDAEHFRKFYRKLHRGETQLSTTVRLWDMHAKGYIWKRCTYTILPSRNGKPIYALGSAVEVTDQVETKQKYEDAIKYRYRTLGENVLLAGHCNVTHNVILEVEDRTGLGVEQRFGMVREEFFRGIASLIPDDAQQQTFCQTFGNENMQNSFQLGITQHDYSCTIDLGAQRGIRWISTHVDTALQPKTGELIGFLTVTDVSASKMQQQVLDAVIQFDYDFVAHLNLHSDTTVFYNSKQQMAQLKDYQYGVPYCYTDAIEHTIACYVAAKDRGIYAENMSLTHVTQQLSAKDSYEFTYHLREANGEMRTKQTRFSMHDRAAGIVVFSRADVTDMLAQQEKQKIALSESLALAQQANSAKSKFLSSMSHDIRTPMNAIIGMCNLAIADEGNPRQLHESLQVIEQSSALLLSMITDILDMNRIESGKMVLTNEQFSFSEQLKLAAGRARALASKKQQTVELLVDITHDCCSGDIVRIHRVIDNILANALKFTPVGGTIRYHLCESVLERKQISLYRFEISDTGIGISPEQQLHIFEPFYRVQNPLTAQIEGTGLGLSIVKSIVDYMGGTISVHSALDVGTTFSIELPLRFIEQNLPEKEREKVPARAFDLSGVRILLCEDHPMNQLVASRILEKEGVIVTMAENGQLGYEAFLQSKPGTFDAILMDIQMPVMNGYDATRAIRECSHPQAKTIPIIAMTANAFAEDVQQSMDAGMNEHLAKPIEPKQLYETLAMFLS